MGLLQDCHARWHDRELKSNNSVLSRFIVIDSAGRRQLTYRDRSIHSLNIALLDQHLQSLLAELFDFLFSERLAFFELLNPLIEH